MTEGYFFYNNINILCGITCARRPLGTMRSAGPPRRAARSNRSGARAGSLPPSRWRAAPHPQLGAGTAGRVAKGRSSPCAARGTRARMAGRGDARRRRRQKRGASGPHSNPLLDASPGGPLVDVATAGDPRELARRVAVPPMPGHAIRPRDHTVRVRRRRRHPHGQAGAGLDFSPAHAAMQVDEARTRRQPVAADRRGGRQVGQRRPQVRQSQRTLPAAGPAAQARDRSCGPGSRNRGRRRSS